MRGPIGINLKTTQPLSMAFNAHGRNGTHLSWPLVLGRASNLDPGDPGSRIHIRGSHKFLESSSKNALHSVCRGSTPRDAALLIFCYISAKLSQGDTFLNGAQCQMGSNSRRKYLHMKTKRRKIYPQQPFEIFWQFRDVDYGEWARTWKAFMMYNFSGTSSHWCKNKGWMIGEEFVNMWLDGRSQRIHPNESLTGY